MFFVEYVTLRKGMLHNSNDRNKHNSICNKIAKIYDEILHNVLNKNSFCARWIQSNKHSAVSKKPKILLFRFGMITNGENNMVDTVELAFDCFQKRKYFGF